MNGVLLQAFAEVARSQGAASGFWEQASLCPLGLRVGGPGDVLDDDTPFTSSVLGTKGTRISDVTGTDETFTTDPVALVELLSFVERVIEFLLLFFADSIDQIVSGLIGNVSVFLED